MPNHSEILEPGAALVSSRRRRRTSRVQTITIQALAVLAGISAAATSSNPVGQRIGDLVVLFLFGATVVWLASFARRWTWYVAAGIAALASSGLHLTLVAAVAILVAVAAGNIFARNRALGALIATCVVHIIVRQGFHPTVYWQSIVGAAAVAPLVASGLRSLPQRIRRPLFLYAMVATAVMIVLTGLFGVQALRARSAVRNAIDTMTDATQAFEDDNPERAAELMRRAQSDFTSANSQLGALWIAPVRWIPVVGNNLNALITATEHGSNLAGAAADAVLVVDLDALRVNGGQVNLLEIRAITPALNDTAFTALAAQSAGHSADSPWLLGPVDAGLTEFNDELDRIAPALDSAASFATIAPDFFGENAPRTYLVVFFTPAELRGLGGFIGAFAELHAEDGKVSLGRTGRPDELNAVLRSTGATLVGPDDYLRSWAQYQPQNYFQDVTFSPDFPTVANVITQLYPQGGGTEIDGVVALDPTAIAAFTEFTGPIDLGNTTYGRDTLADFLLHGQYLDFASDDQARQDVLNDALRAVFSKLLETSIPSPRRIADALGSVVEGDRLMITATRPGEAEVFLAMGAAGEFPSAEGRDLLGVTVQNNANNKVDYFLQRSVHYQANVHNGVVDATITIDFTNNSPSVGLPPAIIGSNDRGLASGLNRANVTIYSPHRVVNSTLDGSPVAVGGTTELGVNAHRYLFDISAGQTRRLVLQVQGTAPEADVYRLMLVPQPSVLPELYQLSITGDSAISTESFALTSDTEFPIGG